MKVAVLGALGYGGQVLMRLLMDHPEVGSVLPVSHSAFGKPIDDGDSGLGADPEGKLLPDRNLLTLQEALDEQPDAVFSALPHKASAECCGAFFGSSVIFDLSADFRLKNADAHRDSYGTEAPFPELRPQAIYGLAEVHRTEISESDLIAVPGCYPTCSLLALLPAAQGVLIEGSVTINALSGISGAGRSAKEMSLFVERSESVLAYNPGRLHRHLPEMEQELQAQGCGKPVFFTPHLVPMRRGMAATISFETSLKASEAEQTLESVYREAYESDPGFVKLCGGKIPSSGDVIGSNRCDIAWKVQEAGGTCRVELFSVIDNLLKGAAGQAVQDFNIRFGFTERTGLPLRSHV